MPRLSDIQGQPQAVLVLRRAISAQRLAQAYLFSGPEGVGKVTTARALAAALNCPDSPGEGCDGCSACRKVAEGVHPDLHLIAPDQGSIKIDRVRALEEHLGFAPHEGKRRIIVVDGADLLNLHAANALLKSVEEPRPATLFILASAAPHRVVPTLVSRCQRIRFFPLRREALAALVARHSDADSASQGAAVSLARGSVGRALRLLESAQVATIQGTAGAILRAAQASTALAAFEAAGGAGKERLALAEALDFVRTWLRDLLLLSEGLDTEQRLVNIDRLSELRAEASGLSHDALLRRLRAVDEAEAALRGNVQQPLVLENLIFSFRGRATP
jgi:DNA polymerase-3 subunit delta'